METISLVVEKRNTIGGNGRLKELRNNGTIPGILYQEGESHPIQASFKDISGILKNYGGNAILQLDYEGKKNLVFIKEVQREPVKHELLHFDLQPIGINEKMQVFVPLHIEGQGVVESKGGILQRILQEIEIEALPQDIPRSIEIDISQLNIGDAMQVEDLKIADGIEILSQPNETVLLITEPALEEKEDEDVEELEEPEIV